VTGPGVPCSAPGRGYWGRVGVAADRLFNALLGGPDDQTASQTLGFHQVRREWIGLTFAPIVDMGAWVLRRERHHCLRSLYGWDAKPFWPDRMPPDAPATNPYP